MNSSPNTILRPKQVVLALQLFYASIVVSIIHGVVILLQAKPEELEFIIIVALVGALLLYIFLKSYKSGSISFRDFSDLFLYSLIFSLIFLMEFKPYLCHFIIFKS